jgi:dihydroorotate dehydrogenase
MNEARALTTRPIVSVGGIMSPEDACARIRAGASLVQLYSGWIYGGPAFPGQVTRALRDSR